MGFILGLIVGGVAASVVFIIFGKNNKRKIASARTVLLEKADQVEGAAKELWEKLEKALNTTK